MVVALLSSYDEPRVGVSVGDLSDAGSGMSLDNCRLVDALIEDILTNVLRHQAVQL